MLDVVEVKLELAERVKVRDGGVLLDNTMRCVEMKEGTVLEEAFLVIFGKTRVVVLEVGAVVDDTVDCERRPKIGPRICAFEFASKAICAASSTCTVVAQFYVLVVFTYQSSCVLVPIRPDCTSPLWEPLAQ